MSHPSTRGERRAVREQYIRRRKFIATQIWNIASFYRSPYEHERWWGQLEWEPFEWGKYAKYNLNCGCMMCHSAKYFSNAHKRRKALRRAESQADFRRLDKVEGR
jgi:hypothetical protein